MNNMLNKLCVLELNKSWFPISLKTPKKVFENFSTGNFMGLHMDWSEEDLAKEDYSNPIDLQAVKWDDWLKLPVRPFDLSIRTTQFEIRIPSIVICSTFNKIPNRSPKLSKRNIMMRDNYTCQFTGKQLDKNQLNIDHIVPRSKGGKNTWENLVTCHKDINTKKRDRTPSEAGLSLIRTPVRPTSSALFFADKFRDPKWEMFLGHL
jgi:5-methylcytosine-specific restriction endonuclease McrA